MQIRFLLIDVMIMGLKLSPSNTNKYITGTLNKGGNGGKRVVFLGWNMGREGKRRGRGRGRGKKGKGKEGEGEGKEKGRGKKGRGRGRERGRCKREKGREGMGMGMINIDSLI